MTKPKALQKPKRWVALPGQPSDYKRVKIPPVILDHCLVCKGTPNRQESYYITMKDEQGNEVEKRRSRTIKGTCTCKAGWCSWCGQWRWMDSGQICASCQEDEDRLDVIHCNEREARREARKPKHRKGGSNAEPEGI